MKLPRGFRIAPVIEYRSGFPYIATDAYQNYAGIPNLTRYPGFRVGGFAILERHQGEPEIHRALLDQRL